jgi:ABC-type dipeptide/oligopeptide/nickel transport system permease component
MVPTPDRPTPSTVATIGRRLLDGVVTAWAAVSLTFFAIRLVAGDPAASLLSQGLASPEQVEAIRRSLGYDQPLLIQYFQFLKGLLRGDMGTSLYTGRPVSVIIAEQFPATARLALLGFFLAALFGLLLGVTSAWRKGSLLGEISAGVAGLATGLPVAFTGVLTLMLVRAGGPLFSPGSPLSARSLLLPALVLGFSSAGALARVVDAGLRQSMREPYMLAARARGIHGRFRLLWHALRPALPPAVSLGALEAAFLFAGTVVTETVFARPGLGRTLVSSILQGDFPIAQGIVALAAAIYAFSHLAADVAAFLLDPRLKGIP